MKLLNKEAISISLVRGQYKFIEMDSRLNYGLIGYIEFRGKRVVTIFPETFYIVDSDWPVHQTNLLIIQSIQREFKELTRDSKNRITVFKNMETRSIEMYIGTGTTLSTGNWHTDFVEIPVNTPERDIADVSGETLRARTGEDFIFCGIYSIPSLDDKPFD